MSDPRDTVEEGPDDAVDEAQAEIDADLDGDDAPLTAADASPLADGPEDDGPVDDAPVDDAPVDDEPTEVIPAFLSDEPEPAADRAPAPEVAAEPESEPQPETAPEPSRRSGWGRWAFLLTVLVLVGGYFAAAVYASERVAAGTTVQGVDIGGMTRDEAVVALRPAVKELNSTPVAITRDAAVAEIVPRESGLAASAGATVDGLVGFSLSPLEVMRTFTGTTREVELVTVADQEKLASAIDGVREHLEVEGEDASVEVSSTGAAASPAVDGIAIDAAATAEGLGEAWPVDTYAAVLDAKEASVTTAEAEAFAAELNSTTLAGDVRMTGENGPATVTAEQLTRLGSVVSERGALVFVVDGPTLAAELEAANPTLVSEPTSASFRFTSSHDLVTSESKPGRGVDGEKLGEAVVAGTATVEREGVLPYRDTKPAVTSDELGVSDFKTKVASFSTPLTDEPVRTQNLIRGAEKVTGVVVKPDETFSLLDSLAPITEEGGYQAAHIIVDGYLTNGIGGGLSQMATTTYNAAYFAGLEDVEHRPHTKWFDRYPAGREATIFVGALDMRFKNNTPYALVMSSYVAGGELHVDIWSTKHFTVKTYASDKTNYVQPKAVESTREGCLDTPMGNPGFTITNTREVFLKGELVDKTSYTWSYQPDNGVTCK